MESKTPSETVTLYFRQGSSDKVYQAFIEASGTGFSVNFAYGRRGTTLQTGTKTPTPVQYDEAKKIFDKLLREKTAKGYSPGESGTPYQNTDKEDRSTGVQPQLLNPIDESDLDRLINSDEWVMQEKFDGKRVLIRKKGDDVAGINRQGLIIALPKPVVDAAVELDTISCLLDGECVGETYIAFDLLEDNGKDLRARDYLARSVDLITLVTPAPSDAIRLAETAVGTEHKQSMLKRLREQKKEGVVFKRKDAPYTPGRPAGGGNQLKCKFYETASCIVAGSNRSRRSVRLEVFDGGRKVPIGNVTIPPNHPVPPAGSIVEIRYLYAYAGGSLYQPVYLCRRDDLNAEACQVAQLKLKSEDLTNQS